MQQEIDIKSLNIAELSGLLKDLGQPAYRAKQIFKWLQLGAGSFDEMTDLPKDLRQKLAEHFRINKLMAQKKQVSKIDGTVKYLWKCYDDNYIETVLMSYEHGYSICISTQAGCRMGCAFCASTIAGLARHLTPSEMLDQIIFAQKDQNIKISNIVLMGTGEPLDNFDNVLKFLELVNAKEGLGIGQRHISLSTCGLVDKIYKLAEHKLQITLSISLHAPNDEIRSQIMPINRSFPIRDLLSVCKHYFEQTGRRISFEYAMIDGVNDTPACAKELANLLRGMPYHVNLIMLNKVEESPLKPSKEETVKKFMEILEKNRINATLRRRLGSDIDASCGQLRSKNLRSRDVCEP